MNETNPCPQGIYTLFERHVREQRIRETSAIIEEMQIAIALMKEREKMWLTWGQGIVGDV